MLHVIGVEKDLLWMMVYLVIKVFVELYNDGLIYKDKRLVNWDPKLKTAISDLEVDQRETKGVYGISNTLFKIIVINL